MLPCPCGEIKEDMIGPIINVIEIRYPILYYPFWFDSKDYGHPNEVSGIVDASFQDTNIYWQNTIGYKSGVGSLYCSLHSKTTFLKIPATSYLASNGFTIAFRINIITGQTGMIYTNDGGGSRIFIYSSDIDGSTFNIQFGIYLGTIDYAYNTPNAFSYNTWYHIVWVVNPGGPSYAFINGGSINGGTDLTVSTTSILSRDFLPNYKCLFCDPQANRSNGGALGYLSNFYYYGRPVTQDEITTLYIQ